MQLPLALRPFQKIGEKLLHDGKVKQVEFSGNTYQVQVIDEKAHRDVWSFLQLDNSNRLKDSFCSCDESEDVAACPHLVASYLHIFNKTDQPLHKRFEKSLWNTLCHLYSDRLKIKPNEFKQSSHGTYAIYSLSGKQIFVIKCQTKEASLHIKNILFNRHTETEETSLKFSNLTQEEITLWKEGRPSSNLSYELSFWSDLAKWMMSLQDKGEKYHIEFDYSPEHVPNYITIKFQEFSCKFYISQANLPSIIPALATVESPLPVHRLNSKNIIKITYDKENGCLLINRNESKKKLEHVEEIDKGLRFGSWLFVPQKGFYPLDPLGLLSSSKICGDQITRVLNENFRFIKEHLDGEVLHEVPLKASYAIHFDDQWNLHINTFALSTGDLQLPNSKFFGEWAYLQDKGFYKLDNLRFKSIETLVQSTEVGDFIQQHRSWLNMQEGFETHIASVETQLTYKMASEKGPLSFHRTVASDQTGSSKDFGSWVYITGQGFYAKVTSHIGLPIRPGTTLVAEQIPLFIRINREELKMIPGFFSEKNPIVHAGLDIFLDKNRQITITPYYDLLSEYHQKLVGFFDEFTYVEGEGFSELPSSCRLPVDYRTPVHIDPNGEALFLNYELPQIKPLVRNMDSRLQYPENLKLEAHQITRPDPNKKGLYAIQLSYLSELGEVPLPLLWTALKKKQHFCFSPAGLIDLKDKRFEWLRLIDKNRLDRRRNILTLSTIELIRLNAFDLIEVKNTKKDGYQQSLELLRELTEFYIPEDPDLTGFECTLRPYQQVGLNWLWFLYHHGLSGMLCDDMGLGKTHQTMGLLTAVTNYHKKMGEGVNRHFLIICPTSVIYHWQDKLAAFLPGLRVCTFYGSNRSLKEFKEQYDILLTSYGIWRNEHDLLSQIPFEVAVLDEIQIAKNHNSRLHTSLASLNAQMRLGLTGTPIENHLRELKSLFDLTLPSYMPGEKDYREFFIKPIEKDHDPKRKALLSRLIHPFVLRRKKEDVLIDLPEKIEEISHCGLLEEQARMYNEVVERSRKVILEELNQKDQAIPYIHVFAILSYLKQICDHPACYLKQPENYKQFPSGKWDLFVELLNEARESQQKVVVYTQYLHMLDIMQNYLNEAGIRFASIRGATTNRGEELKRFNEDPTCEVFLGSLQASGLGIELTAASVVIHYDRWWNAARENQATDRVHRLGQTRGVQVFKLVTKGTFEEKIDAMITRKGKLMEDIVGVDDQRLIKHFDRDEIIELLQSVKPSSISS